MAKKKKAKKGQSKKAQPDEGKQPQAEAKQSETKTEPKQEAPEKKLPDDVKQRTKEQFDKLTDSNKRLVQANRILQSELQKRAAAEKDFSPLQQQQSGGQQVTSQQQQRQQPQQQAPQSQQDLVDQFVEVDPVTGQQYVDERKLRQAIANVNTRAANAERKVQNYIQQQQQVEQERQTKKAFKAHPELNPDSEDFDEGVHRRTRALLMDSMMNPQDYGGHALTFKEAGDQAKEQSAQEAEELEEKVEEKRQQAVDEKTQASASVQGQSTGQRQAEQARQQAAQQNDALVEATRKGDMEALARRLSHTPHTGTPSSE